jgi:hypothetical protein
VVAIQPKALQAKVEFKIYRALRSANLAQGDLFFLRVKNDLGPMGQGVMQARRVRCDDGLTYVAKDDPYPDTTVRAAELFWTLIARRIGLPVPVPHVIVMTSGRSVFATREEPRLAATIHLDSLNLFLSGKVEDAGRQIVRLYAFDLFCGNEDRKPDNYLLLREDHGIVPQGIDLSHTPLLPGVSIWPSKDPLYNRTCHTRIFFPEVISSYQSDRRDAEDTINRLEALQLNEIETILREIPDDWLEEALRSDILAWWGSVAKTQRIDAIRTGIVDGTLL